jgi:hypothetical protein
VPLLCFFLPVCVCPPGVSPLPVRCFERGSFAVLADRPVNFFATISERKTQEEEETEKTGEQRQGKTVGGQDKGKGNEERQEADRSRS